MSIKNFLERLHKHQQKTMLQHTLNKEDGSPVLKENGKRAWGKTGWEDTPVMVLENHILGRWAACASPFILDGTDNVNFFAIDIDLYKDEGVIKRVEKIFTSWGLKDKVMLCSSKSGGVHIWFLLKEPTAASKCREFAKRLALYLELVFGLRSIEIFPKQDKVSKNGSAISMPFFDFGKNCKLSNVYKDGKFFTEEQEIVDYVTGLGDTLERYVTAFNNRILAQAPVQLEVAILKDILVGHRNNAMYNLSVYSKKFTNKEEYIKRIKEVMELFFELPNEVTHEIEGFVLRVKPEYQYDTKDGSIWETVDATQQKAVAIVNSTKFSKGDGGGKKSFLDTLKDQFFIAEVVRYDSRMGTPSHWELTCRNMLTEGDIKKIDIPYNAFIDAKRLSNIIFANLGIALNFTSLNYTQFVNYMVSITIVKQLKSGLDTSKEGLFIGQLVNNILKIAISIDKGWEGVKNKLGTSEGGVCYIPTNVLGRGYFLFSANFIDSMLSRYARDLELELSVLDYIKDENSRLSKILKNYLCIDRVYHISGLGNFFILSAGVMIDNLGKTLTDIRNISEDRDSTKADKIMRDFVRDYENKGDEAGYSIYDFQYEVFHILKTRDINKIFFDKLQEYKGGEVYNALLEQDYSLYLDIEKLLIGEEIKC